MFVSIEERGIKKGEKKDEENIFFCCTDDMGELGFDPLGLTPSDPKEKYDLQTKELNNGRCAKCHISFSARTSPDDLIRSSPCALLVLCSLLCFHSYCKLAILWLLCMQSEYPLKYILIHALLAHQCYPS